MDNSIEQHKPLQLRIIFILNGIMTILPFVFYAVFVVKDIRFGDLKPIWMVYTGLAYMVSFALLIWTIVRRKLMASRAVFLLNFLIAVPAGAYIGIVFALVSLLISLLSKQVSEFYNRPI